MTLTDLFRSTAGFRERESGVFEVEGLDFEGWVTVTDGSVTVIQDVPMLNATVESGTVAPVVEKGWRETFERRVVDVTDVSDGALSEPELSIENDRIRVETAIHTDEPTEPESDEPTVPDTEEPSVPESDEPTVPDTDEPSVPESDEQSVPDTVRHVANYVETTWAEGIIPGYGYDERVQAIRERTRTTGNE